MKTSFNVNWLLENFQDGLTFFDIGCANLSDSIELRMLFPNAVIYGFDCGTAWKNYNESISERYNINYYFSAVSDIDGEISFYQSSSLNGVEWPWSSSICKPDYPLLGEEWEWNEPLTVPSTTIKTFCQKNKILPDFMWIDAQGAEQKILSNMGNIRPKAIWAEISEFTRYVSGTTFDKFLNLMQDLGYVELYRAQHDSLFGLKTEKFTTYEHILPQ